MIFLRKKTLFTTLAIIVALVFGKPLMAQEYDYTDQELKNFGKLLVEVITIQQNAQREMIALIQENDLTISRFNEMMAQFQESGEKGLKGTRSEKKNFLLVAEAIGFIQERMGDELAKTVVSKGMTLERYDSILADYQADPKLQEKIRSLAE